MITNTGFSFGWTFPGWQVLVVVILVGCLWLGWKNKNLRWGWWLIVIGGGMNMIERLIFGGVNDYLKIPGLPIYNNINDWLIAAGVGYLLWKLR